MDFINIDGFPDELQIEIVPVDTSVSQNWESSRKEKERESELLHSRCDLIRSSYDKPREPETQCS